VTASRNNLIDHERSFSLHGLVSIRVRGSEIVAKTIDAEFGNPKLDKHSAKNINLNLGMKIDLQDDLIMLGDGIFYSEDKDAIITSINKEGISLRPDEIEVAIEGDPLSVKSNNISISTPRTIPYEGGLSGGVSRTVADIKADTIPHIAMNKEERWASMLISSVLHPILYFTLPTLGHTFIHAAGLAQDNKGIMIIGHSNVGKTSLALEMVMDGYSFLGDDLVILSSKGDMLSFPKPVKLEGHNIMERPEILRRIKKKMGAKEKLFFKMLTSYLKNKSRSVSTSVSIGDVLENPHIISKSSLTHVIHVKRYSGRDLIVNDISPAESVKEAALNLFWEFECQEYRNTKPFYAFKKAHGEDYTVFLEEHHSRIMDMLTASFANVKSYLIEVPISATTHNIYSVVKQLLNS
jgi:hypothetical protein